MIITQGLYVILPKEVHQLQKANFFTNFKAPQKRWWGRKLHELSKLENIEWQNLPPCDKAVLFQGFPTSSPRPYGGPQPARNWVVEVMGKCVCEKLRLWKWSAGAKPSPPPPSPLLPVHRKRLEATVLLNRKLIPLYTAAAANMVALCIIVFLFQQQLLSPIPKNSFRL